jgi:hypothetical protein
LRQIGTKARSIKLDPASQASSRSFVSQYPLESQTASVGSAIHQDTAFLTAHAIRDRFGHGNFVFGSAVASMRSSEPLYEFGHARNMGLERPVIQRTAQT